MHHSGPGRNPVRCLRSPGVREVDTHGNSSATPGPSRVPRGRRGGVSVEALLSRESNAIAARPAGSHRRGARGVSPAPLLAATAVAGAAAASVSSVVVLSTGNAPVDLVRGDVRAAGNVTDGPRLFSAGGENRSGTDYDIATGSSIAALAQLAANAPTVLATAALPQLLPGAPQEALAAGPVAPSPVAPPAPVLGDPTLTPTAPPTTSEAHTSSGSDRSDRGHSGGHHSGGHHSGGHHSGGHHSGGDRDDHDPSPSKPPTSRPTPSPSPSPDPTPSPSPDPTPSPDPDPTPSPDPEPTPDPEPSDPPDDGGSDGGGSDE